MAHITSAGSGTATQDQAFLRDPKEGWTVSISKTWDVLGPFPIHAREQHFLSPSFPLTLSEPIDFGKAWPSSYADGGQVSWTTAYMEDNGDLKVSFPNIRWDALRATEGWAALQHHAVLRATLTLHPPANPCDSSSLPIRLSVHLQQGTFFAILPASWDNQRAHIVPQWHAGNVYAMPNTIPATVDLPISPSMHTSTEYDIFVSGDYEIRLFGDPLTHGSCTPVLDLNIRVDVEVAHNDVVWEPTQDVVPDFIDGLAFGRALGVGLRSVSGWWTVISVKLVDDERQAEGIWLVLMGRIHIAPTQTRLIPITIRHRTHSNAKHLKLQLLVTSSDTSRTISAVIPIRHLSMWNESTYTPIQATYFSSLSTPTAFVVIPPKAPSLSDTKPRPPLVALSGAGVDVLRQPFWAEALPRQRQSWIIIPTGRTSWGLDWHGPSAEDAWEALDSLASYLNDDTFWIPWKFHRNARVIVLGHSNGGQGALYLASRYPDRVLGVITAAGYIKSQSYVPWTMSHFTHYVDPSLRAILETALTPDDNDLFLSNLVDTPMLVIHGGKDENVPTWHSREAVSILRTWASDTNLLRYREDAEQPHWYPWIFKTQDVQAFIDACASSSRSKKFTLTVAVPAESGSMHGWRVESLAVPGRLGRLHVVEDEHSFHVKTTNVHVFSFSAQQRPFDLVVDGSRLIHLGDGLETVRLRKTECGAWKFVLDNSSVIQPSGRLQLILTSTAPLLLVVPDEMATHNLELSIALRIARDLYNYHRLDAEIVFDSVALRRVSSSDLGEGNIVVIGGSKLQFTRWVFLQSTATTAFELGENCFKFGGRRLAEAGLGILFLHPHPALPMARIAFLSDTDAAGMERVARLFPIRTGVLLPDWLIIRDGADSLGGAALLGAGVWGKEWGWNEAISWLD